MNLFSKTKFKSARFVEIGDELRNPERGWYQIHTFVLSDDITMVDREYTLNNLDTVALLLIDIGAYKNKSLDAEAMSKLRMIFSFFRDYRLGMIVRIVYDTTGRCMENEPSNEEQIIKHMTQVARVINEYAANVFVYQGLLIGNWGEMHSSKFLSPSRLKKLYTGFRNKLDKSVYISVRRPSYIRILFPQGEEFRQKDVGIFDDAILASPSHLGTFGELPSSKAIREHSWKPSEEISYVSRLCDNVPYGGEALWPSESDSLDNVRASLKEIDNYFAVLHLSYLNRIHDVRFLNHIRSLEWKGRGPYKGLDGYEYIGRHLGYRFVVRGAKCSLLPNNKDVLKWEIEIENIGFARSYFTSAVYLEGDNELGERVKIDVSDWIDLTKISSRTKHVFVCMTDKIRGKIYLSATKANTKESIFFANKKDNECADDSYVLLGKCK